MNTTTTKEFVRKLPLLYGLYTGTFAAFVIVLAILEQFGLPDRVIGYLFVFLTISVYATIGIVSRTTEVTEYYVVGRMVPPVFNGMATGADWMSGASFVAMAGSLYGLGYDGMAFVLGWTGGYVLVATLIAPYLRKFGAYTVPDFLGARYGGNTARLIGVIVLMSCSFVYIMGQILATGTITSRFLGIQLEYSVFIGLIGILVCSILGGMRAVTWTQVAQYIILIIAYLIPVTWLSIVRFGIPVPQLAYGRALQEIALFEADLGVTQAYAEAFTNFSSFQYFTLIACLMLGTASLPHVLMRFFTTPSIRAARSSVAWSLFFIFLLYFTAPAYAAFAKLEVYQNVIGQNIASLPEWVGIWANIDLVSVQDANGDGILDLGEFSIVRDAVVLATPEIAGMPYVIAGLVSAGGLAAALSTADGLLLAIANALSHDIYFRMINPNASAKTRLIVARILLLLVALVAAIMTLFGPRSILQLVAWAFSLAASGLFCALVLGVWSKRINTPGAIAGMIAGFGTCLLYTLLVWTGSIEPIYPGLDSWRGGVIGVPIAFVTTYVVSMLTPEPDKEIQDFVDNVRIPKGKALMEEKAHGSIS